jgi:hypothetical protein
MRIVFVSHAGILVECAGVRTLTDPWTEGNRIDPVAKSVATADATADSASQARHVMCSQLLWYSFRYSWGTATTKISGMFLDRGHAVEGRQPLFRFQNFLSTEIFRFGSLSRALRTLEFFWSKRSEILYRLLDSRLPSARAQR